MRGPPIGCLSHVPTEFLAVSALSLAMMRPFSATVGCAVSISLRRGTGGVNTVDTSRGSRRSGRHEGLPQTREHALVKLLGPALGIELDDLPAVVLEQGVLRRGRRGALRSQVQRHLDLGGSSLQHPVESGCLGNATRKALEHE